jgi:hypothetical protein
MAELLFGLGVLLVGAGLLVGVAVYRRRRVLDVYRQEGERLLEVAQVLMVVGVILVFVMFIIVNNR